MHSIDIQYKKHFGRNENPFNEEYVEMIQEKLDSLEITSCFFMDELSLWGEDWDKIAEALTYIGYCFGMVENGR